MSGGRYDVNFSTGRVIDPTLGAQEALKNVSGTLNTALAQKRQEARDRILDNRYENEQKLRAEQVAKMDARYAYQKKIQEDALNRQLAKEAEAKKQDQILHDVITGVGDTYDTEVDVPATPGNEAEVNDIKAKNAIRAKHLEELNSKVGGVVDKFAERYNYLLGKVKDPKQLEAEKRTYNIVKGFYPESQWTDAEKKAYTPTGMTKEQAYEQAMKDSGMDAIVADYTNPNLDMQAVPELIKPVAAHTDTVTKKMDNAMKAAALKKAIRSSDLTGTNMVKALERVDKLYPVKQASIDAIKYNEKLKTDNAALADAKAMFPKSKELQKATTWKSGKTYYDALVKKKNKPYTAKAKGAQKWIDMATKVVNDRGDTDNETMRDITKYASKNADALGKMTPKEMQEAFARWQARYYAQGVGIFHNWIGSAAGDANEGFKLKLNDK